MPSQILINSYRTVITKLLPIGKAWNKVREHRLFVGLAVEFARIFDRGQDFLNKELYPGTADELLPDWEQLVGLPDECTPEGLDIDGRRQQVLQKMSTLGGANAQYFQDLATLAGFNAIVTNYRPFRTGISRVGEPLSNDFDIRFRVGTGRVGQVLRNTGWRFWFQVNVEATNLTRFRVGYGRVGQALVTFSNPLFECTVRKLKPAHAAPFFTFREP